MIASAIKSFTDDLQTKKGIAKNLLAKHRLAKILYDRHQIKITFFQSQNMTNFGVSTATLPAQQNRAAAPLPFGERMIVSKNCEFAPRALARGQGFAISCDMAPCRMTGRTTNYTAECSFFLARGQGFEPRYAASKAAVLPLDDPRIKLNSNTQMPAHGERTGKNRKQ